MNPIGVFEHLSVIIFSDSLVEAEPPSGRDA